MKSQNEITLRSSDSLQANRWQWCLTFFALLLLMTGPSALVMSYLKSMLHSAGMMNLKDLAPLAGDEYGTMSEFMLNAWNWDAATFVLYVFTIPNTVMCVWILAKQLSRNA
jgi:hypothetical protein